MNRKNTPYYFLNFFLFIGILIFLYVQFKGKVTDAQFILQKRLEFFHKINIENLVAIKTKNFDIELNNGGCLLTEKDVSNTFPCSKQHVKNYLQHLDQLKIKKIFDPKSLAQIPLPFLKEEASVILLVQQEEKKTNTITTYSIHLELASKIPHSEDFYLKISVKEKDSSQSKVIDNLVTLAAYIPKEGIFLSPTQEQSSVFVEMAHSNIFEPEKKNFLDKKLFSSFDKEKIIHSFGEIRFFPASQISYSLNWKDKTLSLSPENAPLINSTKIEHWKESLFLLEAKDIFLQKQYEKGMLLGQIYILLSQYEFFLIEIFKGGYLDNQKTKTSKVDLKDRYFLTLGGMYLFEITSSQYQLLLPHYTFFFDGK